MKPVSPNDTRLSHLVLVSSLLLAWPWSANAQGFVWSAGGASFATLGDVDQDGVRDFAMDSVVYSGRDGRRLYAIPAMPASRGIQADFDGDGADDIVTTTGVISGRTGTLIAGLPGADAAAGDIDKDGTPDLVRITGPLGGPHSLQRLSGKTGTLISQTRFTGLLSMSVMGSTEDVNGDRVADVIVESVSCLGSSCLGKSLLDGVTGNLLVQLGDRRYELLLGDVDGDGVPDFPYVTGGICCYTAGIVSGKTGNPIVQLATAPDMPTGAIAAIGDHDKDRIPDVAVLMVGQGGYSLGFFSGKTGRLLSRQPSPVNASAEIRGMGDVDGDGLGDLAVRAWANAAWFWRSSPPSLTTGDILVDVNRLSSRRLDLDAGTAQANRPFLFLGTLSGTRPGFTVLGQKIPLNYDAYTALGLAIPNGLLIHPGIGLLDGQGKATSTLVVPPGLSSLKGLTMHHAAVGFAGNSIGFVSNPVPLVFH